MKKLFVATLVILALSACSSNKTKPDSNMVSIKKQYIGNNNLLAGGAKAEAGWKAYVMEFENIKTGEKKEVEGIVYKMFADKYTYIEPGEYRITLACFPQYYKDEKQIKQVFKGPPIYKSKKTIRAKLESGQRFRPGFNNDDRMNCMPDTLALYPE